MRLTTKRRRRRRRITLTLKQSLSKTWGPRVGRSQLFVFLIGKILFFGQVSILRAKIISGLSIAGKTVQVKKLHNGMFNFFLSDTFA